MVVVTTFVASLLTGGLGIYVGARLVVGEEDYLHALVTGLLGAIVWVVGGLLFGWIPLIGPLLVLLVYIWMVNRRFDGGRRVAAKIAIIAWACTAIVLVTLAALGLTAFEAFGFPDL